ncbi:PBS lyase HEAT-like repeat [Planktothrix serta PCC 8927]|uniref:PBS lyase HEAT-like repeat n=1 Tax=Planktothrix serta PCC 8927 TaxID=671068 RepID=A0A7Z9BJ08_9CYAN|nr:HEAT repeat domain-containing protein [Planktothrix serta]VXD15135.1 PBS lyase HEAT-like repeat [Planktothrix serta PCC 8927]
MKIQQIETYLNSPDFQERLRGLTELNHYESAVAIPLLMSKRDDPEFIIRSFVAMGLGHQQSPESFQALLELLNCDLDPNVRAEAANSLSKYGEIAIPYLVCSFCRDFNWLVRQSILEPLMTLRHPQALYEICICALTGQEQMAQEAAIEGLAVLAGTEKQTEALQRLVELVGTPVWRTRTRVALALRKFNHPQAQAALHYLKKDQDHRVVGAALEGAI